MPSGKKRGSKTSFLPDQEPWAGVEVFARVEWEECTCQGGLYISLAPRGRRTLRFCEIRYTTCLGVALGLGLMIVMAGAWSITSG